MMVGTDDVSGIKINSSRTIVNGPDIAMIPLLSNYTTSMSRVSNNDLLEGIDIGNSVIRITLAQGAIGCARLNATTGYQIVSVIHQEDGRFPPLGMNVTDKATGKDASLVAENGFVYLSGI